MNMTNHEHGSMDIKAHEKTFIGFVKFMTYSIILILLAVVFLAIVGG